MNSSQRWILPCWEISPCVNRSVATLAKQKSTLKRAITLPLLVFYGTGTILGAGIYALSGMIAGLSGVFAPVSFLLSALIATFVAFTYAELSSRYPKSAGEAFYVGKAFAWRGLSALVGWGIVFTGIVSAAVMARGFYGYLQELLPLPAAILAFVFLITLVAIIGISLSVHVAALITLLEISGILLVLYVTREHLFTLPQHWQTFVPPLTWPVWQNIVFGAFLAFYAYIGFEDMVNVAEEVIEPEKNLPTAIVLALLISTVFYMLIALALVSALPIDSLAEHAAPFAYLMQQNSEIPSAMISLISLIAILNAALVQIVMGSRVLYGMAEQHNAPQCFHVIHPGTRTPITATLFFAVVLLVMALWLPIEDLARITSFIILSIFALVCLSLCLIKGRDEPSTHRRHLNVPVLVPGIGFLFCVGFIYLQL